MTDIGRVAAVDLGASSGRVVRGDVGPQTLRATTIAQFRNEPTDGRDGLRWNVDSLFTQACDAIREISAHGALAGIAVDSWGVDYGLFRDSALLAAPFHYRDARNEPAAERVLTRVSEAELYARTGVQHARINTAVQLADDQLRGALEHVDQLHLIPDLFGYWLTGEHYSEQTIVSTTSLNDPTSGGWDAELIARLGYPSTMFPTVVAPGTTIGPVTSARGMQGTPLVTAIASHDTASALVALPVRTDDFAYISCGTWAIVGLEADAAVRTEQARLAGLTNERGADGRTRIQRNAAGMWLLNECRRAWAHEGYADDLDSLLTAAAEIVSVQPTFDPADAWFTEPGDMPARIREWFVARGLSAPDSRAALVRCILDSLAESFAAVVDDLERVTGRRIDDIHVVGGGSHIALLCQRTADRTGRSVLAGPAEATALGNVLIQGRSLGFVSGSLDSLRHLVSRTHAPRVYRPRAS